MEEQIYLCNERNNGRHVRVVNLDGAERVEPTVVVSETTVGNHRCFSEWATYLFDEGGWVEVEDYPGFRRGSVERYRLICRNGKIEKEEMIL